MVKHKRGSLIYDRASFRSNRDRNTEIYIMNSDGTNPRNLTNNLASDDFPSWSPDGHYIVFTTNRDGSTQIYTMSADGSNAHSISSPPTIGADPVWSP